MDKSTPTHGAGQLRSFLSTARAVARGIMGADAYDKYLEHWARAHGADPHGTGPHAPAPLTEKQFWRERMDRQDANPQSRCC